MRSLEDYKLPSLNDRGILPTPDMYKREAQSEWDKKERDPNGLNSKEPGSKLDAGKSPVMQGVLQYFPRALLEIGRVSQKGAEKYSWRGWESVPGGIVRYGDAQVRHIISEGVEGAWDSDTGLLHAAQSAWNALARLELILKENEEKCRT